MPRAKAVLKEPEVQLGVRAEQRERTRAAILDSAIKVFAEEGFVAAQTRTIASRAKVQHGLVHYHFQSKLKLWKAAVDHLFSIAYAQGLFEGDEQEPVDDLSFMKALIRRYVRFAMHHPEWARILFDEGRRRGPRLDWLIHRHLGQHAEWLQELFRRLQAQGHLPPISPVLLQYIFWGMAHTIFTMAPEVKRKLGVDPLKDEDLVEEQIHAIELLLLGGGAAVRGRNR